MSVLQDRFEIQVNLSGSGTNLLRMARNECAGMIAVVAAGGDGGTGLEMMTFPRAWNAETLDEHAIAHLVRRASEDPEFGHGGPFVRRIPLDEAAEPLTVAVVPLDGAPGPGLLAVIGNEASSFGQEQLEYLRRIARRLGRHLMARTKIGEMRAPAADVPPRPALGPTGPGPEPLRALRDLGATYRPEPLRTSPPVPATHQEPAGDLSPGSPMAATGTTPFGHPAAPYDPAGRSGELGGIEHPRERGGANNGFGSSGVTVGEATVGDATVGEPAVEDAQVPPAVAKHVAEACRVSDEMTGLPGVGAFFSRVGRLLQSGATSDRILAMVILEVSGSKRSDHLVAQLLAATLRAQLRAGDPLAHIGPTAFAAAIVHVPGSAPADAVEKRLARAINAALGHEAIHLKIRSTHLLSQPGDRREADELLREAVAALPGG